MKDMQFVTVHCVPQHALHTQKRAPLGGFGKLLMSGTRVVDHQKEELCEILLCTNRKRQPTNDSYLRATSCH